MPSKDIPDISPFVGFDKLVHICLYLGFAWLLCWALHAERKSSNYFLVLLICILLGLIMETFQFLMHEGRSFELFDVFANTSGAIVGLIIYNWISKKISFENRINKTV
jgi:VanZ family protein